MEPLKDIVIFYHAHCYDGFGAAYAAWKKYGDNASYIPALHLKVDDYPEGVVDREVYVLDFCFSERITRELLEKNKKVVVLDHHESVKQLVQSLPDHVYSETDSGAKIAWKFFQGETVPKLIEYISDSDTWAHALPHYQEIEAYIHVHELDFGVFEELQKELETNQGAAIEKGKVLTKQFTQLVQEHMDKAMLVEFEGYQVYAVNASSFLRSELGHQLALKKGPFSIVYRFERDVLRVSLRGDGSINCTDLALKYGGGGHHDAAAIIMKNRNPLPFKIVDNPYEHTEK